MKKHFSLLLLLMMATTFNLMAQDDVNQMDENGRRQGLWIRHPENGQMGFKGFYKDGLPNGEFVYFDAQGRTLAKGCYVNKKKDGKWQYFNVIDDSPLLVETYKSGVLDGLYEEYYPNGTIKVRGKYTAGTRTGKWETFDPEGNVISVDEHQKEDYDNPELDDLY